MKKTLLSLAAGIALSLALTGPALAAVTSTGSSTYTSGTATTLHGNGMREFW